MAMFGSLLLATLVALAASGGMYVLHTEEDASLKGEIAVITHNQDVEQHLAQYKDVIGHDYEAYRNHIYRVLTYALHIFKKPSEKQMRVLAAGLVYHDLGLWSDNDLDYLVPSITRAKKNLAALGFTEEELHIVSDIIMWHHKVTPFYGNNTCKDHVALVEAVRRADWIDATKGLVSKGMPRQHIAKVQGKIANAGFHQALLEFGYKLHRWNLPRHLEILRIFRW